MAELLLALDGQRTIWTVCRVRKAHKCWDCRADIPKGAKAFRPLTNGDRRMYRLCQPCLESIAVDLRHEEKAEQRGETER